MIALVVDTHAVIWYYTGAPELTAKARAAIDAALMQGNQIGVSSISLVEIVYLIDKGRVAKDSLDLIVAALDDPSMGLSLLPLDRAVALAMRFVSRSLVPDMPDRIITATALQQNVPLVSADRKIQATGIPVIW